MTGRSVIKVDFKLANLNAMIALQSEWSILCAHIGCRDPSGSYLLRCDVAYKAQVEVCCQNCIVFVMRGRGVSIRDIGG